MSRYAAWLRPSDRPGQAAEPSADFEELEDDDVLLEALDPLDEEPPEDEADLEEEPDEEAEEPLEDEEAEPAVQG